MRPKVAEKPKPLTAAIDSSKSSTQSNRHLMPIKQAAQNLQVRDVDVSFINNQNSYHCSQLPHWPNIGITLAIRTQTNQQAEQTKHQHHKTESICASCVSVKTHQRSKELEPWPFSLPNIGSRFSSNQTRSYYTVHTSLPNRGRGQPVLQPSSFYARHRNSRSVKPSR